MCSCKEDSGEDCSDCRDFLGGGIIFVVQQVCILILIGISQVIVETGKRRNADVGNRERTLQSSHAQFLLIMISWQTVKKENGTFFDEKPFSLGMGTGKVGELNLVDE